MNPLTQVKRIQSINAKEAQLGISEDASWHAKYKDSAYVYAGGIPFDLTEGDLLAIFAQYGEIVDVNLVRDKATGKSKGFAFVAYEDQRSTILAVDNLNGAQVAGRTIRVDHVSKYKKKEEEDEEEEQRKREERGVCRAFQRGECTRGAACRFSHNEQRAANTGWGAEDKKWGHDNYDGPRKKNEEEDEEEKQRKRKIKQTETRPSKRPKLMTIGVAGGSNNNQNVSDGSHSIVLLPDYVTLPYSSLNMPHKVRRAVECILTAIGAEEEKKISAGTANKKKTSMYSKNLQQIGKGIKVPSSGWKCSKCAERDNLWMNLTDGTILCGRVRYDGSGGNNHAIEHYEATKYPLVVKLGTLTADLESADVFSYPEGDSVIDPQLAQHLTYFGLDFSVMQKTQITTAELALWQKYWCDTVNIKKESKEDVEPLFGPGYNGLVNLGYSCYMAAIMQVVLSTQSFCSRYYKNQSLKTAFQKAPADPTVDFNMQLTKLAHGLLFGKYSVPVLEEKGQTNDITPTILKQDGIPPRMFKAVIASDHADFSSNEQQDAMLFFLDFINKVERAHDGRPDDPVRSFKFGVEERCIMCQSGKVSFTRKCDHVLSLIIPLHQANIEDFADEYISESKQVSNDETVQRVSLAACLDNFLAPEEIQYDSTTAMKTVGLTSFPDYLTLHLKRYGIESGVQKKLDVPVDVPDIIDISHMRSKGLQHGEEFLPEKNSEKEEELTMPVADDLIVARLVSLGFELKDCQKAAINTSNAGLAEAVNWLRSSKAGPGTPNSQDGQIVVDRSKVDKLISSGFQEDICLAALKASNDDIEKDTDWTIKNPGAYASTDMDATTSEVKPTAADSELPDGEGRYRLIGIVSHIGPSIECGHAHVWRDDKWVIFDDAEVGLSVNPPKDKGYLYFFERIDSTSASED